MSTVTKESVSRGPLWIRLAGLTASATVLLGFFGYATVHGLGLPRDTGLFMWIFGSVGFVLSLIYVATRARSIWAGRTGTPLPTADPNASMGDIEFDIAGVDKRTAARRLGRFYGGTLALIVGVWLLSFHVAVPTFVVIYLRVFAKVRWRFLGFVWLVFLAAIVLIFDYMIVENWHRSWLEELVGIRFGRTLGNLVRNLF